MITITVNEIQDAINSLASLPLVIELVDDGTVQIDETIYSVSKLPNKPLSSSRLYFTVGIINDEFVLAQSGTLTFREAGIIEAYLAGINSCLTIIAEEEAAEVFNKREYVILLDEDAAKQSLKELKHWTYRRDVADYQHASGLIVPFTEIFFTTLFKENYRLDTVEIDLHSLFMVAVILRSAVNYVQGGDASSIVAVNEFGSVRLRLRNSLNSNRVATIPLLPCVGYRSAIEFLVAMTGHTLSEKSKDTICYYGDDTIKKLMNSGQLDERQVREIVGVLKLSM